MRCGAVQALGAEPDVLLEGIQVPGVSRDVAQMDVDGEAIKVSHACAIRYSHRHALHRAPT